MAGTLSGQAERSPPQTSFVWHGLVAMLLVLLMNFSARTAQAEAIIPIYQTSEFNGQYRYFIPVAIGASPTFNAMLDTGSTNLLFLPSAHVSSSDYHRESGTGSVDYGSGVEVVSDNVAAYVTLGGVAQTAQPMLVGKVASSKCYRKGCMIANSWIGEFPAIIGVGLRGTNINPLTMMAGRHRWIVELPEPFPISSVGKIIIDPTDEHIKGYTLFKLPADPKGGGWEDDVLPVCVINNTTGERICGNGILDTGAWEVQPLSSNAKKDGAWPSCTPATLQIQSDGGTSQEIDFLTGVMPGSVVDERPSQRSLTRSTNTGAFPFFAFSVLYDYDNGMIGLRDR